MDVLPAVQIAAVGTFALGGEALLHEADGHVEEDVQVRARKPEMPVLGVVDPLAQVLRFAVGGELGALVGDIGIDVAVQKDRPAGTQPGADLRRRIVPVFGKEQGHQLRVDALDGAESAAQELADEPAVDRGVIAREMDVFERRADSGEVFSEHTDLGGLAGAVQAFYHD